MLVDPASANKWRQKLERYGGRITNVLRATPTHGVIVMGDTVVKVASDPAVKQRFQAQAEAERFFRQRPRNVDIPLSDYQEYPEFGLYLMPHVTGQSLCRTVHEGPTRPVSAACYRQLAAFALDLYSLAEGDVRSEWLLEYSYRHWSELALRARLVANATVAVERGLLESESVMELVALYDKLPMERGPNHHDLGLWNVIEQPTRACMVLDAEYARYSFRGYDIIYLPLQWSVNAWFPSETRAWVRAFDENEPGLFATILTRSQKAVIYRYFAMAGELRTDAASLARYRRFARLLEERDVTAQHRFLMGWDPTLHV